MKATDKAYIAGIIDGEGTLYIGKKNPEKTKFSKSIIYNCEASISNTHFPVLKQIQRLTGGKFFIQTMCKNRPRKKKLFRLWYNRVERIKLLKNILPYLIIKKTQALLLLKMDKLFHNKKRKSGVPKLLIERRDKIYLKFKKAQRIGKIIYNGAIVNKW